MLMKAALALLSLTVVALAGLLWLEWTAPLPPPPSPDPRLAKLAQLESQVAGLQAQLSADRLELRHRIDAEARARQQLAQQLSAKRPVRASPRAQARRGLRQVAAGPDVRTVFDAGGLRGIGVEERDISLLRGAVDQLGRERNDLRERAKREGWDQLTLWQAQEDAMSAMLDDLRVDYGDDFYDLLLYSMQTTNRVRVDSIGDDSMAGLSGLLSGDLIYAYDGKRIFTEQELLKLLNQGRAGGSTRLDILRDGEVVSFELPRGPLGIQTTPARVPPH